MSRFVLTRRDGIVGTRRVALAEQIEAVTDIAIKAQAALRIVALGIDYGQYHRFRQLTPEVYGQYDGKLDYGSLEGPLYTGVLRVLVASQHSWRFHHQPSVTNSHPILPGMPH